MATLLEFPRENGSAVAEHKRYQENLAVRFVFWRKTDLDHVVSGLEKEFPMLDVVGAVEFARVVVSAAVGRERLEEYVRGTLTQKLAA